MTFLLRVRNHPITLLAVVVAGLAAWIAIDHVQGLPDAGSTLQPVSLYREPPRPISVDALEIMATDAAVPRDRHEPGVVTADVVSRLQPGMARAEVEGIVGLPPAELVQPITSANGRFTYMASYLANLEANSPPMAGTRPVPRTLIGLEFDATRPGHPLVKIHLPTPMS